MSNAMNTNTNGNGYPIFAANQVLKYTDLNSLVVYLDQQTRLTRTHLIGIGIVCGLELSSTYQPEAAKILISEGCGVTSEGYLIALSETFLTHYQPDQSVTAALFNPTDLTPPASPPPLVKVTELFGEAGTNRIPLHQTPEGNQRDESAFTSFLTNQVMVVVWEPQDDQRDSCLVDCDDRGQDRNFRLRFFLINKSQSAEPNALSAETLLRTGFDINSGQTLDAAFQGWFNVPDCQIDRLGYTTQDGKQVVDLTKILSFDDLMKAYYHVCKAGILSIDAALQQTHALFGPFISTFLPSSDAFTNLRNRLRDILIGLVPLAIADADRFPRDTTPYEPTQPQVGYGIQYFYDYLVELVTAFNELKDALFDLMDGCMPDMGRFPKYLLAGEVVPSIADCPRPSLYRHSFYQPPIYNSNQQRKKEVRHLYERLVRMSKGFSLLPFYQTPVKVTPSRSRQALLGEQAIPYYYKYADIYPYWNYDACRKQRAEHLPAYFRLKGPSNGRGHDLIPRIDWSDFFRIEGHVGRPLNQALDDIKYYKDCFNLAFDVVPVRLGDGAVDPSLLKGFFDDLETEFDQLKTKWQKKYQRNQKENQSRPVTKRILQNFNKLFFSKDDLTKINLASIENDFLQYARDPHNYKFETSSGKNRLALQFPSTNPEDARIALLTEKRDTGTQIERTVDFSFFPEGTRLENQKRIIDTFATCLSISPSTLGVEIDPIESNVYRFVLSDGEETIEFVEGTEPNERTFLLRLEDETRYESPEELINRYQDFEALYAFLQFFGQREGLDKDFDFAELVSYYEFRALFRRYFLRLEVVKRLQQLTEYAKEHRGLDHLGGVPKGGTLVLVYTDDFEVINDLIKTDSTLLATSIQQVSEINTKAQFPVEQVPILEQLNAIGIDRFGKHIVVADFCLPYYCCGASSINYVIDTPCPCIYLPKSVFCENDTNVYNFTLCPPGGLLKGGDGIVDDDGKYAFRPSDVDRDTTEPTNLTFFYIVDGVSSSFTVLMLPLADVSLSIREGKATYCVSPGSQQLIQFLATPPGGEFRLAINDDQPPKKPNIKVGQNNSFDLATIPFPDGQNSLTARFTYTVPSTDDYCSNISKPLEIVLVRQPRIDYGYGNGLALGIGGDLIEFWEDR